MNAVLKYVITVESDVPPTITLGQTIGGAVVKEMKEVDFELVPASYLAKRYNLSSTTIREKLASINQGTAGKALYNPKAAHTLLTKKSRMGRPRAN